MGKRSEGKPPHEPNDLQRRLVCLGVACRMTPPNIAMAIGVGLNTLYKYYKDEIAGGKAMLSLRVADAFERGIARGDTQLIKLWAMNEWGFKGADVEINATIQKPQIPMAIQEFNKIIAAASIRPITIDHAAPVQDGLVLLADSSPEPEGRGS